MSLNWVSHKNLAIPKTCDIHANSVRRFFCIIYHLFLPHPHNGHYPHVLRPNALVTYSALLIGLKVVMTGILFISFPSQAFLSQEILNRMYFNTNESRTQAGLSSLSLNENLIEAARVKASDMTEKGYFSHFTPEGDPPWYFIDRIAYPYTVAGENLAMNFTSAETVHKAFLASPSHKRNILDPRFKEVGFAVANGTIDGADTQILVEFFGAREEIQKMPEIALTTPPPSFDKLKLTDNYQITNHKLPEIARLSDPHNTFSYSDELLIFTTNSDFESLSIKLYRWSTYLFQFFIIFLVISLAVNLIIKIRIQHGHLIVQTLLVIVLVTGLLYIRIHFIESIPIDLSIN